MEDHSIMTRINSNIKIITTLRPDLDGGAYAITTFANTTSNYAHAIQPPDQKISVDCQRPIPAQLVEWHRENMMLLFSLKIINFVPMSGDLHIDYDQAEYAQKTNALTSVGKRLTMNWVKLTK